MGVARRGLGILVSAVQEATTVFVARMRGAGPGPRPMLAATPGEETRPNRDYFRADQ